MKHLKVSLAAALLCSAAGGLSPCPAQTTKPKARERRWPNRYEITVKVPEILQKHLAKEFFDLATAAYPQADAKLIRQDAEKKFLCEEYTFQVGRHGGANRYPEVGKSKVRFVLRLPLASRLSIWTTGVPTGMKVKVLDEPLTLDQAKPIAESAMKRIPRNLLDPRGMKLTDTYTYTDRRQGTFHRFTWSWESSGEKQTGQQRTAQVFVRSKDGVVKQVTLVRIRTPAPKVPFKEIAARAKKSIPRFQPARLRHTVWAYYGKSVSIWRYDLPAPPAGSARQQTEWDAETGKLLYSHILKGGTRLKPYRNPDFFSSVYFEPTEEAVKSHLEKLVADIARELEQTQKAPAATSRSATTRTQPADDGPESRPTFSRPEERGEDLSGQPTPALIRRLSVSRDKIEQRKAAKVLGDRHLRGVLKLSASDKKMLDGYIRRQCALTAAPVGNDRSEADNQIQRLWRLSTDVLLESLDSDKIAVSEAAAKNLALMRNEAIIVALIAKIRDGKNPTGRRMAVFAFLVMNATLKSVVPGRTCLDLRSAKLLEDKHIIPFLVAIQKGDKDPVVRSLAEQSLQAFKKSRGGK